MIARIGAALSIALLLTAAYGMTVPTYANVNKAELLASLDIDQSLIHGWTVTVAQMVNLAGHRGAILSDLSVASASVAALRAKAAADSSAAALGGDFAQAASLDSALRSLEDPKIRLASRASTARGELNMEFRALLLSGGLDPHSSINSQAIALRQQLHAAQATLDRAADLLGQASLGSYPESRALLATAGSLINQAVAGLKAIDRLAHNLPHPEQVYVYSKFLTLVELRFAVVGDQDLTAAERTNLVNQIIADMGALTQLNTYLATGNGSTLTAELAKLAGEPGVFLLIAPKAEIMMAGAADRSATRLLEAMVPSLQARIAAASLAHHDVTSLNALLNDLTAQLAGASADIAPIDSEFEPMTAITSAQYSHDAYVIKSAIAALGDANARLTTARGDANQILAATA